MCVRGERRVRAYSPEPECERGGCSSSSSMGDDEQRDGEPYPARFRDSETLVFDMKSTDGAEAAPSFYFCEQTDSVNGVEAETNTALPESTSAQTEDEGTQGVKPAAEPDSGNTDWRHFLDTAVPLMESALDEKVENRVFDDYIYVAQVGTQSSRRWAGNERSVRLLFVFVTLTTTAAAANANAQHATFVVKLCLKPNRNRHYAHSRSTPHHPAPPRTANNSPSAHAGRRRRHEVHARPPVPAEAGRGHQDAHQRPGPARVAVHCRGVERKREARSRSSRSRRRRS